VLASSAQRIIKVQDGRIVSTNTSPFNDRQAGLPGAPPNHPQVTAA